MGLFKKKTKTEETKPESETFKEPITLGNGYNLQQKLNTQIEIDKATIPIQQSNTPSTPGNSVINAFDAIKAKFKEFKYEFWYVLNFHANYFQNLYEYDLIGENKKQIQDLHNKILKCFRYQWMYGNCGLYKLGDKIIPVYEIKANADGNGELTTIDLGLLNLIINSNELVELDKQNVWMTINGNDENYCRLIGSVNGMGAIITWLPFIKQHTSLLKKIYTLGFTLNKKITYSIKENSFVKREIDLFFDDDIPVIISLDGIMGNRFTTEEINGIAEGVKASIEYYNFFIKTYYELLGRRMNVDAKDERNVAMEVDASQNNYDVLQRDLVQNRKFFLDQVCALMNIQWTDQVKGDQDVSNWNNDGSTNKFNNEMDKW